MTTLSKRPPWKVSLQDFPSALPIQEQLEFLLQYAVLAPSTKNTQPWRFSIGEDTIGVFADLTRWQPVSDRGRRELYISLGCALENLLVAAEQFGLGYEVRYFPERGNEELAATIALHPAASPAVYRTGISLDSITTRRTQHGMYRDRSILEDTRRRLLLSCDDLGLRVDLTDDPTLRSRVVELNLHADEMEFADPEFRKELGHWVGQGVFGTPRLLSRLGELLLSRLNLGRAIGKRNAAVLSSAPLIGLISARTDDRTSQLKTGQALERIWLLATGMGLGLHPMSEALEIPSLRADLARVIPGEDWFPEQVFRIGYPMRPEKGHTPRRPLDQVLLG
jgi:nitroreductase